MTIPDKIEFYDQAATFGRDLVATVDSSMVPPDGSCISIEGEVWRVKGTTFALDDTGVLSLRRMRACVAIEKEES